MPVAACADRPPSSRRNLLALAVVACLAVLVLKGPTYRFLKAVFSDKGDWAPLRQDNLASFSNRNTSAGGARNADCEADRGTDYVEVLFKHFAAINLAEKGKVKGHRKRWGRGTEGHGGVQEDGGHGGGGGCVDSGVELRAPGVWSVGEGRLCTSLCCR